MDFGINLASFLVIILPGFVGVYLYHRIRNKPRPQTEFEYIGLSFVWGLVVFYIVSMLSPYFEPYKRAIETNNPYVISPFILTSVVLSIFSAWLGYRLGEEDVIKKVKKIFLRKPNN